VQLLKNHRERIFLVAGSILIAVTALVGLGAFLLMKQHAQALMSKDLQLSMQDRVHRIETEINAGFGRMMTVTTHRFLIDQMQAISENPESDAAHLGLKSIDQHLLSTGLTAIALMDKDGRELARLGSFAGKPEIAIPLDFPGSVQLMWDRQWLLHAVLDMKQDGRIIGKVIAEILLPESGGALTNPSHPGETGALFLCTPFDLETQCFSAPPNPRAMTLAERTIEGLPLPSPSPLDGQHYRNRQAATAYAPVGRLGFGLALKTDSAQLHAPAWTQPAYLLALLVGLLGAGLLLLRWQLGPLVARLVDSEAAATKRAAALTGEIAEHNKTEAELLEFKNVMDNMLDTIVMIDPQTLRFVYLNQGAISNLGYTREELLGMAHSQIIPWLSESEFRETIASVLAGEQASICFDTLCQRKDGSNFPVAIFLQMAMQSDRTHLLVAIMRDITERRKIEQMNNDFISVMYHKNSNAVMIADSQGKIISVNPVFAKITGYTQEEVVGKNPKILHSSKQNRAFYQAMWSEIDKVGHWEGELWNRRKNGQLYLEWRSIYRVCHEDSSADRYVAVFSDISKIRQGQIERDALRHANQMKSEFLATMSHELRTPLNAIIGFSEVFKEGLLGDLNEDQSKYIGYVFESGKYLLALINDILDLSKVEAGKMVLDLEQVDISSLLENSLLIVKEKAMANRIQLKLMAAEDIGLLWADARKVKQIVYNLLSNAVKFSPEDGTVTLQARRVMRAQVGMLAGPWPGRCFTLADNGFPEFLEICVTDSGIGISRAGMAKLFQPFSQIDSGLARKFEGTGLGLVMIKNLAELHGGTLALESAEGQGSRFTIWLPLRRTQETIAAASTDPAKTNSPEKEAVAPTAHEKIV